MVDSKGGKKRRRKDAMPELWRGAFGESPDAPNLVMDPFGRRRGGVQAYLGIWASHAGRCCVAGKFKMTMRISEDGVGAPGPSAYC